MKYRFEDKNIESKKHKAYLLVMIPVSLWPLCDKLEIIR